MKPSPILRPTFFSFHVTAIVSILLSQNHTLKVVKNLLAMQETQVRSLSQKDIPENGMTSCQVFLPGEVQGQKAWWATFHGVVKDWTTNTLTVSTLLILYGSMTSPIIYGQRGVRSYIWESCSHRLFCLILSLLKGKIEYQFKLDRMLIAFCLWI